METYVEDACDNCRSDYCITQDNSNFYYVRCTETDISKLCKEDDEREALSEAVQSEYFIPSKAPYHGNYDGDNFEIQINVIPYLILKTAFSCGTRFGSRSSERNAISGSI